MAAQILPTVSQGHMSLHDHVKHDEAEVSMTTPSKGDASAQPPLGFPASIEAPTVWSAGGKVSFGSQTLELSQAEKSEVEEALEHFMSLGLDGSDVSRENFPLPSLGPRLEKHAVDIHQGSGLCIVRGLDAEDYSAEDNTILFLGIASYIGSQRGVQTSKGAMLTHVHESGSWTVPREKRHGIHTNGSLPFHNDMGCEVLAMHVRNCAAQGGGTYMASAAAVYNAMMKANPWAVHTLAKHNWPVQVSRGSSPFVLAPLIGFQSGNLVISTDPSRLGPHPAIANNRIPDLLPAQKEALALLQQAATAEQVRLPACKGDMVFLNNWGLLHARESYEDDSTATRHLVRLYLRNDELSWDIPKSMKTPWEASFGSKARKVVNRQYPVAPMPEYMEPKFTNGSAAFIMEESSDEDDDE
ncbi:Clavaminate synthase-like protein [Astrocystis sublimbata]|nr:Clavaminate synthase-like protein [Astrocystis sublimbata]